MRRRTTVAENATEKLLQSERLLRLKQAEQEAQALEKRVMEAVKKHSDFAKDYQ